MLEISVMAKPVRVIRRKELQEMIGVSRSTIYDWLNPKSPRFDKEFPKPFKLGAISVGWLLYDVCEWIQGRSEVGRGAS